MRAGKGRRGDDVRLTSGTKHFLQDLAFGSALMNLNSIGVGATGMAIRFGKLE